MNDPIETGESAATTTSPVPVQLALLYGVPFLLTVALLWQTTVARRSTSITFDETLYLNCALQTVHDGWLDKRLSESGVGALPVTLWGIPAAMAFPRVNRPDEWKGTIDDPPINAWSRWLNSVLIGVPLVLIVYAWLLKRRGPLAASVGGAMLAFSPSILAHASLATTDACFALFGLLGVAALAGRMHQPTWGRFVLLGIAMGLTLAAKYSGVFLFPVVGLLLLFELWPQTSGAWWKRVASSGAQVAGRVALLVLLSGIVLWGTDWFSFTGPLKFVSLEDTPPDSPWISLLGNGPRARWVMDIAHRKLQRPSVVGALISRYLHNRDGHSAFLMGQRSQLGWRHYFPCAWVFKSTLPELILTLTVVPLLAIVWRSKAHEPESSRKTRTVWLVAIVVFWALVCLAHVNIGQRYLIVLYPLTVLLAIDLIWLVSQRRQRLLIVASVLLVGGQVASAALIAPRYLSYFSPLIGGPSQGRFYLADSNIDWGQDLPALREQFQHFGYRKPLIEYFGTAEPAAYGIEADAFGSSNFDELGEYDVFAISVNRLNGVYMPNDALAGFRQLKPTASAGYSILLFDLAEPGARDALIAAWKLNPATQAGVQSDGE